MTVNRLQESPNDLFALSSLAADALGIPEAAFVEKDFWAIEILRSLQNPLPELDGVQPVVVFKGGTSLSKAYGLIRRFSDDIDVMLHYEGALGKAAKDSRILKP